jgi:hypothetical protein
METGMKYIFLNIKNFAVKNRLFFILFVICQITSFTVLFFSFGAFQNFKIVKNRGLEQSSFEIAFGNITEEGTYDDGSVYCIGDGSVDNGSVKKLIGALDESTCRHLKLIFYSANTDDTNLEIADSYENLNVAFRLKYSESDKNFVRYGNSSVKAGKPLTVSEYMDGSNKITLPCDYDESYLGENVTIAGENYIVSGINYLDDNTEMSYYSSPDGLDGIENISFDFKNVASLEDYNNISAACKEVFGDYAHLPKIDTVSDKLPFYNSIMAVSVMLALLSAVTLMILYKLYPAKTQQNNCDFAASRLFKIKGSENMPCGNFHYIRSMRRRGICFVFRRVNSRPVTISDIH